MLKTLGQKLACVLHLDIADPEAVLRATGRRVHPGSGRSYHVKYQPPKVADKDDLTGEPLVQREDDNEACVKKRLNFYHKVTEPIVAHYERQGVLHRIDGGQSVDAVWEQIDCVLKKTLMSS